MIYKEIVGDLFTAPNEYYLAHCISSDFVMGAGIAPLFTKHFNTKYNLLSKYPGFSKRYKLSYLNSGYCIQDGKVFNLITKHLVWEKPTYETVTGALNMMKTMIKEQNIKYLAMPRIACGIDGLNWDKVSDIIKSTFEDYDIEIIIYVKN